MLSDDVLSSQISFLCKARRGSVAAVADETLLVFTKTAIYDHCGSARNLSEY